MVQYWRSSILSLFKTACDLLSLIPVSHLRQSAILIISATSFTAALPVTVSGIKVAAKLRKI